MKKIFLIICTFLLVGCWASEENHSPVYTGSQDNELGNALSGIYTGNQTNNKSEKKNFQVVGKGMVEINDTFYIEGNACLFEDYILAIVSLTDEGRFGLEIGSNCIDRTQQGPIVNINYGEIPIKDNVKLEMYDYVKVYYEFPEDFIPTDYIDYLNYSTEIEVTGEKSSS